VISVDGPQPDVETARRYRLRYIYVPVGYAARPVTADSVTTATERSPPNGIEAPKADD
jgi:hypothetical protein